MTPVTYLAASTNGHFMVAHLHDAAASSRRTDQGQRAAAAAAAAGFVAAGAGAAAAAAVVDRLGHPPWPSMSGRGCG
eukprot:1157287-Pelagomonas_calceolata.AAC.1